MKTFFLSNRFNVTALLIGFILFIVSWLNNNSLLFVPGLKSFSLLSMIMVSIVYFPFRIIHIETNDLTRLEKGYRIFSEYILSVSFVFLAIRFIINPDGIILAGKIINIINGLFYISVLFFKVKFKKQIFLTHFALTFILTGVDIMLG